MKIGRATGGVSAVGKPGTANQFQRRELVAVPVLRRTHESGIFETVPGLRSAYFMVRAAELEAVPFGFTTCTVHVRAVAPTFTATFIWLADADWIVVP